MKSTFGSRAILRSCVSIALASALPFACRVETDQPIAHEKPMEPAAQEKDAGTPCELVFGADCGATCTNDGNCRAGLHCESGVCHAECIGKIDCPEGDECSSAGRCIESDGIFLDPAKTDPTDTSEPPVCIEGQVEFKAVVPQVWLLLDRSGSMSDLLSGTTTRWAALGAVLFGDPVSATDRGVVGEFADRVAFGAVFYTSGSTTTGCVLDLESVALAANNYRHIRERYNKLGPTGGTPTADSIAATIAVAASSDLTGGPKLLVLATDGAPGTCSPGSLNPTADVEGEVTEAFKKQIQTFAISISTGTDIPHMQRVANLGVGLAADAATPAPLYTATSQEGLKSAFSTILTELPRSCVFSLNGRVATENADQGEVVLNGQTLVYNDDNGWILKQPDQVELTGTACTQVQEGEAALKINFPCAVFTPVVK